MDQQTISTGIFLLELDIQQYENKLRYIRNLPEEDRLKILQWQEIKEKEIKELHKLLIK